MVIIKPFKGIRPKKGLEKKIASLPYDVLDTEEAKKIAKGNKYSYLHISKPEIDFQWINPYSNEVYQKGKENFEKFIKEGYLIQDKEEHLYIYKQKMGKHEQIGLVACVSCEEYDNNIIKKHELTRKDKEDDRTRHIEVLKANDEPVFLTYKAKKEIDKIIAKIIKEKEEYKFISNDKIKHTFWVIKDKKIINSLIKEFEKINYLYISDGHHRIASASRVRKIFKEKNPNHNGKEEYNYFLAVIFPHNQLKILPYNRVVKDLNGLSEKEFLEKVKEEFEIIGKAKSPKKSKQFSMYLNKKWYLLKPKQYNKDELIESLDVSILQNKLLNKVLGIKNPREDKRINFVGGIKGIKELEKKVNSKEFAVAFSLYPISIEEIIKIADSGKIMPPKSTWFEPKLRSGLFVHSLD